MAVDALKQATFGLTGEPLIVANVEDAGIVVLLMLVLLDNAAGR
jgi:hypothetical protein